MDYDKEEFLPTIKCLERMKKIMDEVDCFSGSFDASAFDVVINHVKRFRQMYYERIRETNSV